MCRLSCAPILAPRADPRSTRSPLHIVGAAYFRAEIANALVLIRGHGLMKTAIRDNKFRRDFRRTS